MEERKVSVVVANIEVGASCQRYCDIPGIVKKRLERAFYNHESNKLVEIIEVDIVCSALKVCVGENFRCQKECQAKLEARAYDINARQVDSCTLPPPK